MLTVDSYIEIFNRFGDIELVHGGDDDGRCGEEEEQDEEDAVDDEAADPPGDPTQRQVLPAEGKNQQDKRYIVWDLVGVLWGARVAYQRTFCGSGAYETLQL